LPAAIDILRANPSLFSNSKSQPAIPIFSGLYFTDDGNKKRELFPAP
jgi:hypothetical protein